jgi:hypothetical protein
MKKVIMLLCLVSSLNGQAQALGSLLTYNTIDDFFDKKSVNHGYPYFISGDTRFKLDSLGTKIKYNIKKHKIFAYEYDNKYFINVSNMWQPFFGGNKKYIATSVFGTSIGGYIQYEKIGDGLFFVGGSVQVAGGLSIYYYRATDLKKVLTLEELIKDCPEVYNQYMISKKEKGKKNDVYSIQYVYDQNKFFQMYIECKDKH